MAARLGAGSAKPAPRRLAALLAALIAGAQGPAAAQATARQETVARSGAQVMPFSLAATIHVFTKTADGGTQRVLARQPQDAGQVIQIRAHLRELQRQFTQRDFSAPERIHGAGMPGLAQLRQAPPAALAIDYREIEAGAQLRYTTTDPQLRAALHAWFDAQLADHGHDAVAGHDPAHAAMAHAARQP
jgi:hypothetical protein